MCILIACRVVWFCGSPERGSRRQSWAAFFVAGICKRVWLPPLPLRPPPATAAATARHPPAPRLARVWKPRPPGRTRGWPTPWDFSFWLSVFGCECGWFAPKSAPSGSPAQPKTSSRSGPLLLRFICLGSGMFNHAISNLTHYSVSWRFVIALSQGRGCV